MNLPLRALCTTALVGLLAWPVSAQPGLLALTISNGRVILFAEDVSLRQILTEWERVGGTRIVNKERVSAALVTVNLADVPEDKALETLLRSVAGFAAIDRSDSGSGASKFARIVIMRGAAAPKLAGAAPQAGPSPAAAAVNPVRPQIQRRVLADGRDINFIEDENRPGALTVVDDNGDPTDDPDPGQPPGMMRPPFNALPGVDGGQGSANPFELGGRGRAGLAVGVALAEGEAEAENKPAAPSSVPSVIGSTSPTPGSVLPGAKPNQPPPGPRKPPGR